ncbi:24523_t:CDS:2, partial [Gigaspora rosea]
FHVIHEPINPISRAYVTKNFEFLNQIPLPKPTDPITIVHHFSPSLNEILAPHYYNDDKIYTLRVFAKEHASNFLDAFEGNLDGNPLGSKKILSKFKHTFIIRDPEKSNITGEDIVLVDADDLVREPEKIFGKYCEMVNVEFKKEMLEWKEERLKIWDLKLSGPDIDYLWHKNVIQSTGFDKSINCEEEIEYPQHVYDLIAKSKPHYDYLFQHRIKI